MEIIYQGTLPDGSHLTVEDWRKDYPGIFNFMTVAYPRSKWTIERAFAPNAGETFRCGLWMETEEEARETARLLESGEKTLADYFEKFERRDYLPCVTGRQEDVQPQCV